MILLPALASLYDHQARVEIDDIGMRIYDKSGKLILDWVWKR